MPKKYPSFFKGDNQNRVSEASETESHSQDAECFEFATATLN